MMGFPKYVCAVDIGSSKVAGCVAMIRNQSIVSLSCQSVASKGIRDGVITDHGHLVGCLGELMRMLRKETGLALRSVYTTLPGNETTTRHSRAVIPLAERGNKIITEADVRKVEAQAKILGASLDEEIIHAIPVQYAVDARQPVDNPLGLYGHKLEVDMLLVCGKTSSIQNLDRVIHQTGYEIQDIFFSGLVIGKAVLNRQMQEGTTVVCDIGSDTTELMLFSNGVLRDIDLLNTGSQQITLALHDTLKIPLDLAEELKKTYGAVVGPADIAEDKEILVRKSTAYRPIKQRAVVETVTQKAQEMCRLIRETLERRISTHQIDHCIVVGRTGLLEGFIETFEQILSVPVRLGLIENPHFLSAVRDQSIIPAGQNALVYLNALGTVCTSLYGDVGVQKPKIQAPRNPLARVLHKARVLYDEYF
jgi:cell division protein FtsA